MLTKKNRWLRLAGVMLGVILLAFGLVRAQGDGTREDKEKEKESEMDREIRYAEGLMDLRLPDFASAVMAAVEKRFPEARAAAARLRVDAFASQGKFDQAEVELAKIPSNTVEYMSARLLISDRYYQFSNMPKAREGYDAVLGAYAKNGPPPELRKFYMESAYKYSQMLLNRNDTRGAIKAMRYVLVAKPETYMRRTIEVEMAEMMLKIAESQPAGAERTAMLKEVNELCASVMWEQDLLFGRAVVVLAHSKKIGESLAGARKLVAEKLPMLEAMEQAIRESVKEANPKVPPETLALLMRDALRESPMSQCRYLMGTLYAEDGRIALSASRETEAKTHYGAALTEFFRVIRNYPSSSWAPEACQHTEKIMAIGRERGWGIDIPPSVNMNAILANRYKDAHVCFSDGKYSEAAKYFLQALNVAPEYAEAGSALGMLAQCYVYENNERYARAVTGYLGERYSRNSEKMNSAGHALLGIARAYQAEGQGLRAREIKLYFTDLFPAHDQTPVELLKVADAALRVTNHVEALPLYQKVVDKYNRPGSRNYLDALSRLARCQAGLNDHSNAVATLKTYFGVLPENSEKIAALVRIADSYRRMENWEGAVFSYSTVMDLLNKTNNPYSTTADPPEENKRSREAALFYLGYCYSRMKPPPEQVVELQNKAIDSFNTFLKEYPNSDLAPSVLSNIGTLMFLQNRTEEANKVFDLLDKKYPNKISGIFYVQFMSLMDLGRFEKAVELAAKMAEEGVPKYSSGQFLTVGNRLLTEAKNYAGAVKAFSLARDKTDPLKDRTIWEQASIGLGKALVGAKQAADAAAPVSEVLRRFPRGPYTPDANQVLSSAYAAQANAEPNGTNRTNLFKQAIGAMAAYRQYLKAPGLLAAADMDLSRIQLAMGEKRKALATYQRVFDLQPADSSTIACIEEAFILMVPMLLESQRFDVALEAIDYYLKVFPKGKHVVDARMWRSQLPGDLVARADEAAAAAPADETMSKLVPMPAPGSQAPAAEALDTPTAIPTVSPESAPVKLDAAAATPIASPAP